MHQQHILQYYTIRLCNHRLKSAANIALRRNVHTKTKIEMQFHTEHIQLVARTSTLLETTYCSQTAKPIDSYKMLPIANIALPWISFDDLPKQHMHASNIFHCTEHLANKNTAQPLQHFKRGHMNIHNTPNQIGSYLNVTGQFLRFYSKLSNPRHNSKPIPVQSMHHSQLSNQIKSTQLYALQNHAQFKMKRNNTSLYRLHTPAHIHDAQFPIAYRRKNYIAHNYWTHHHFNGTRIRNNELFLFIKHKRSLT